MKTIENIEFYRSRTRYYFIDHDTEVEGEIKLGYENHGGETYPYVDYVETDCGDYSGDTYEELFEKHLDLILTTETVI